MSEKMELAQHIETGLDDETEGFFAPPLNREEWRTIVAARRGSAPAQESRFDSGGQRIERSEPDEGRRDAGSNPVAIDPALEPVATEPVAWDSKHPKWEEFHDIIGSAVIDIVNYWRKDS